MNEQATPLEAITGVTVRLEQRDGVGDVIYTARLPEDGHTAMTGGLIAVEDARLVAHRIRVATGESPEDIIAA